MIPNDFNNNYSDQRPDSAISIENHPKLFDQKIIDSQTKKFPVILNSNQQNDSIFIQNNPSLFALKNKFSKNGPIIERPITSTGKLEKRYNSYSLLNKQNLEKIPNLSIFSAQQLEKEKQSEILSLSFEEDPVSYFFKHKDGRGHLFIYLIHEKKRIDPDFNFYLIKKVPHSELQQEYFTMSANGVTYININGNNDSISLEQWSKESSHYSSIKKLKFFRIFSFWKFFKIWKMFLFNERYLQIKKNVINLSIFNNYNFFQTLFHIFQFNIEEIIIENSLKLIPQSKFRVNDFKNIIIANNKEIELLFQNKQNLMIQKLLLLDAIIRDPKRTQVTQFDYIGKKKIIPNLGMLLDAKNYIEIEGNKRNKNMQKEVKSFGEIIRMVDYFIIESLTLSFLKALENAKKYIDQEMSSIFQIEINFNNKGELEFSPSLEELKDMILNSIHDTINCLDNLPKLRENIALRPHLRECYDNVGQLLDYGPEVKNFIFTRIEFNEIKSSIIKLINDSYNEAVDHSQGFSAFFGIFQIGKSWSPSKYIHPRGGNSIIFDLTSFINEYDREEDQIIYNPSAEMIVDFISIRTDVENFKKEELRLGQFRACTVRGSIYIDSKSLRSKLSPIPVKSVQNLNSTLKEILTTRVDRINHLFWFCTKKLKKEPIDLSQFVTFSELIKIVDELTPFILNEIEFVNELYILLETIGLGSTGADHLRGALKVTYKQFLFDQKSTKIMYDQLFPQFKSELQIRVEELIMTLSVIETQNKDSPIDIDKIDLDFYINEKIFLKKKINNLESEVRRLSRFQRILGIKYHDLLIYDDIKSNIEYFIESYESAKEWKSLYQVIITSPFNSIDIQNFNLRIQKLDLKCSQLSKFSKSNNILIKTLQEKLNYITPYLDELDILSSSKMQPHHWNKLFESCEQPNVYYPQIKIDELISFRILEKKKEIESISITSQGESRLESEYQDLLSKWKEVKLPLLEGHIPSEESLLIGDIYPILYEITDSQLRMQRMLAIPFVLGLKDSIISLNQNLDHFSNVLTSWKVFQSNWTLISSFFSKSSNKSDLTHLESQFTQVKRRWGSIIRHTIEDYSIFKICSYPSILETIKENNTLLENLLSGILKCIDMKRFQFPRLFFLSDDDVLTLFSTSNFSIFNRTLSGLFMFISSLESFSLDGSNLDNDITSNHDFNRIKVHSILGENGDSLPLSRVLLCSNSTESWCNTLVELMKSSMHNALEKSISNFQQEISPEWIFSNSLHLILIVLNVIYTRDVEECFNNFENNIHSFTTYEKHLKNLEKKVIFLLNKELTKNEYSKISFVLIILNYQIHELTNLSRKILNFSHKIYWKHQLKHKYNSKSTSIAIEFNNELSDFSYEFWGMIRPFIFCNSLKSTFNNVVSSISTNNFCLITGNHGIGKRKLISYLGAHYGKFVHSTSLKFEITGVIMLRFITGAVSTGSWLVFPNIDECKKSTFSVLSDIIRKLLTNRNEHEKLFEFGPYSVQVNRGFSLFFTRSPIDSKEKISSDLISLLHNISFAQPDISKIALIKLISCGYKNASLITGSLISILDYIISQLLSLKQKSKIFWILRIISYSKEFFEFEKSKDDELNFEKQYLIKSIYFTFEKLIPKEYIKLLINSLHIHFKIFSNVESLEKNLYSTENLLISSYNSELFLNNSILLSLDKLTQEYIKTSFMKLLNLMEHHKVIILYGDSNSGKSTLIKLLKSIPMKYKKINSYKVFHQSENILDMYGFIETTELNPVYHFGLFHSFLKTVSTNSFSEYNILHFDGPINKQLSKVLSSFIVSEDDISFQIHSFKNVSVKNTWLFLETDSIENLTPDLIPYVGLFPLKSTIHNKKDFDTIFDRVLNMGSSLLSSTIITFRTQFKEISPIVISWIERYNEENTIKLQNNTILFQDILPEKALLYSISYLLDSNSEEKSQYIKEILIHSYFIIYSGFLDQKGSSLFDSFLRRTFLMELPIDWVMYNVDQSYWNAFPRPSLASVSYFKNKFSPYLYDKSTDLSKNTIHINGLLPDDIYVCPPSFIPLLHQSDSIIRNKNHLIISGPKSCGKSTLLKFLFSRKTNYIPVTIPVTNFSTGKTLLRYISNFTSLLLNDQQTQNDIHKFVLIFDNLPPTNINAIEFIRQIVSSNSLYRYSDKDPKVLDYVGLNNFIVIVTTNKLSMLPLRFISNFMSIQLFPYSFNTISHIFSSTANALGLDSSIISTLLPFLEKTHSHKEYGYHFKHLLDLISIHTMKKEPLENTGSEIIRCILYELKYLYSHKISSLNDYKDFITIFQSVFRNPSSQALFSPIMNGPSFFYPEYEFDSQNNISVSFNFHSHQLVKEELDFMLTHFREKTSYFSVFSFSRSFINTWTFIQRGILYPGRNILFRAPDGYGRYSLSFFSVYSKDFYFSNIFSEKINSFSTKSERIQEISLCIISVINKCIFDNIKSVIYLPKYLNSDELDFLKPIIELYDIVPYFPDDLLRNTLQRFSSVKQLIQISFHDILYRIRKLLEINLHFIYSIPENFDRSLLPYFDLISIGSDNEQYFHSIVEDFLLQSDIMKYCNYKISDISKIFSKIHSILTIDFPFLGISHFEDFLYLFSHYFIKNIKSLQKDNSCVGSVVDFITNLENQYHQMNSEIKHLQPLLIENEEEDKQKFSEIEIMSDTIKSKLANIEKSTSEKRQQIEKLENNFKTLKYSLNQERIHIDVSLGRLKELPIHTFSSIKQYEKDPNIISLFETLCAILGYPPNFDPHGKKLLNDQNFTLTLIFNHDISTTTSKTISLVQNSFYERYLNDSESIRSISHLDGLYQWVSSMIDFAQINTKVIEAEYELNLQRKNLQKIIEDADIEKSSILQVKEHIEEENQNLQANLGKRNIMKSKLDNLLIKTKLLGELMEGLDKLDTRWLSNSSFYQTNYELIFGNTLIFVVFLNYFGTVFEKEELPLIDLIQKELTNLHIKHTTITDMKSIYTQLFIIDAHENDGKIDFNYHLRSKIKI